MSRQSNYVTKKNGVTRRRRQLVVKERNISSDELMAASIGDVEWLDQSLRDGRYPSTFDKNGLAPIHLAALHGRMECLQLLIEKYNVDVNLPSSTGWTPFHLCINKDTGAQAIRCMNYLLHCGADVDSRNDDNVTPIHQAASEGLAECVKKLLEHYVDLDVPDVRGHLPLDMARLWGHKKCARMIRTEMWRREKEGRTRELKHLQVVKNYYGNLQNEAVHQLHNEQEFYGGVAFGNWLDEKGLPENLKDVDTYPRERYPEASTEGLSKRLRTSGGLDDCSQRMDRTTMRQEQRSSQRASRPAPIHSITKPNSKVAKNKIDSEAVKRTTVIQKSNVLKRVERFYGDGDDFERRDASSETRKGFTPISELSEKGKKPMNRTPWNYSTNPYRDPVTDIRYADMVSLSIHPDEESSLLPSSANLSVKLDVNPKPKIKVTMPGGRIKSAEIRMPYLPSNVISDALSGDIKERIRIPQEFKAVHVYDLKKKRQPQRRVPDEVGMHLSIIGDPRFLRNAFSNNDASNSSLTAIQSNTNLLPVEYSINHKRMIDTLNRISPPKAFLA